MILHHVSVGVKDVVAAGRFYDAVLGTLGYKRVMDYSPGAVAYGDPEGPPEFWVGQPHDRNLATSGNGTHIAFAAKSIQAIHAFYKAALKHGATADGEPGLRPEYGPDYYGAFARDLDGNKIEAVLKAQPHVAHLKLPAAVRPKKKVKAKAKTATKAGAKKTAAKKAASTPAKKTKKTKARKR